MNLKQYNAATSAQAILTALTDGNAVSGKSVSEATKRIASTGAKLDNQIHGTAVACIYLSMSIAEGGPASGASPALGLINAMPKGSRVKALIAWFAAFSNVRIVYDKKAKKYTAGVLPSTAKTYAVPTPDAAMAKPFWTVEESDASPADYMTANFALAVKNLLAKATADNAKLDAKGKAALADLKAAAAKLAPAS